MTDEAWLEPKSPAEVHEILNALRHEMEEIYGERLRGLYLYGSYARGDAGRGSDLDVLVVLDRVDSVWEEIERSGHVAAELSLQHDLTVSRAFVSEEQWRNASIPLVRNVKQEGLAA